MRRSIAILLLLTMPVSGMADCQRSYRAEAANKRDTSWFLTMFLTVPGIALLGYGNNSQQRKSGYLMAIPFYLAAGIPWVVNKIRAPKFDETAMMLDQAENPGGRGWAFDKL
ncbi:MAG TPA: hypothetical protein VM598_04755, partial [Bdellovibrionota bacterium]|nr:hypothetical protein [Bdellovibrionota bacterium]